MDDLFAHLDDHCLRIDWKCEISDAVFCMKDAWGTHLPLLEDPSFISLCENYNSETPDEYLLAMGQYFSTSGTALYNVVEDSDAYCLVHVPSGDRTDFEAAAKAHKVRAVLQLQNRKRFGDAPKLLKLAGRLLFEKDLVKGRLRLNSPYTLTRERMREKGAYTGDRCTLLDVQTWPLEAIPIPEMASLSHSKAQDTFAAIFVKDRLSTLKISKTPLDTDSWRTVDFPGDLHQLSSLFWIGEDLVVARENQVWLVQEAGKGHLKCEQILVTDHGCDLRIGSFPKMVEALNGKVYLLIFGQFYLWENSRLQPTGTFALEHSEFHAFPLGGDRIAYVADGHLVDVDLKTGAMRFRTLQKMDLKTWIQPFNADWAVLMRYGYTNKKLDIAQFWNPGSDTWLRMKLGSLGKFGVSGMLALANGDALVEVEDAVLRVKDVLGQLKGKKRNVFEMGEWTDVKPAGI